MVIIKHNRYATFFIVGPPPKLEPLAWYAIVAAMFSVLLALVGFYRGLSALSELHLQVSGITVSIPCSLELHKIIKIALPTAQLFLYLLPCGYTFYPVISNSWYVPHRHRMSWLTLLYTREVPGSDLGSETEYPD
jgi:hypothetical protein